MATFSTLLATFPRSADREAVEKAYRDVKVLYEGKHLLEHALELLAEMLPYQPDRDTAIVCLLSHVPELQARSFEEIEKRYGARVRLMLGEVHVLQHLTTSDRRVSLQRLRLNFFRVSRDVRVFLLILCNQMLTMRRLDDVPAEERRRICSDALYLYAPAAARLGMYSLKHALEDAAFPVLYPIDHERITEQVAAVRAKQGAFLGKAARAVETALREQGMTVTVEGREKHPYSIFVKMRMKTVAHIEQIPDLFALRVVAENEEACYRTLGFLHRLGHPVQNRFKDYIAFPKPNGYQSLHTTLFGLPHVPAGLMTEVQIRTAAMHEEASIGLAAHWSYKEGLLPEIEQSDPHMFVLTPKGDVIELPEGATPLDFAFQVHTALGLSFKAARVNGSIVPLDHALENGDIIEIVRTKDPRPSPRWITLLKTASARNRLKRHLAGADAAPAEEPAPRIPAKPVRTRSSAGAARVARVEGSIPMPVRLAKCCKPSAEEGLPITGVIGRTGEVRIHRSDCAMLRAVNPERRIHATWSAPPVAVSRGAKR